MNSKKQKNYVRRNSPIFVFAFLVLSMLVLTSFTERKEDTNVVVLPIEGTVFIVDDTDDFIPSHEVAQKSEMQIKANVKIDDANDPDPLCELIDLPLYVRFGISEEDYNILVKTVTKEYGYGCIEGQAAILGTIMNRVKSDLFPNTIKEVIEQKKQFSERYVQAPFMEASPEVLTALKMTLSGIDYSNGAFYFCNPDLVSDPDTMAWFNSLEVTYELPDAVFYK